VKRKSESRDKTNFVNSDKFLDKESSLLTPFIVCEWHSWNCV